MRTVHGRLGRDVTSMRRLNRWVVFVWRTHGITMFRWFNARNAGVAPGLPFMIYDLFVGVLHVSFRFYERPRADLRLEAAALLCLCL